MLVVVAHPDDETFGTGSVIASAAAAGARVVVCCATRGEAGVDTSGTTSSREELAATREQELRAAAKVLGASEIVLLDFADSDMQGDMPTNALSAVPIEQVVDEVAAVIEQVQPDVVVAFDFTSVDDHRDHTRIGEAATLAFHQAAKPGARLYHWTLVREMMDDWLGELKAAGVLDAYHEMELGRSLSDVTTVVDVEHVIDARRAAIAEHRTQTSPFTGVSDKLAQQLLARDYFIRIVPAWEGGPVETTLLLDD
jgi:LmbE family N-acetylglucosaminyl deacetylase